MPVYFTVKPQVLEMPLAAAPEQKNRRDTKPRLLCLHGTSGSDACFELFGQFDPVERFRFIDVVRHRDIRAGTGYIRDGIP